MVGSRKNLPQEAQLNESARSYQALPIRVRMRARRRETGGLSRGQTLTGAVARGMLVRVARAVHLEQLGVIVTCDDDRGATLWGTKNLAAIGRLANTSQVLDVVHAPEHGMLVGAGLSRGIVCWDEGTWEECKRIFSLEPQLCLAYHGLHSLFSGDARGVIRRWDLATGAEVVGRNGRGRHSDFVNALAMYDDETSAEMLISASSDRTVRQWQPETGREIRTLAHHGAAVHSIATLHQLKLVATGANERTVYLYSPGDGTRAWALRGDVPDVPVTAVFAAGAACACELVSVDASGSVRVWDVRSSSGPVQCIKPAALEPAAAVRAGEAVYKCAYAPGRSVLYCATAYEWRVHTALAPQQQCSLGPISAALYHRLSKELLLASDAGVSVWSLTSGRQIVTLPELAQPELVTMCFDPDESCLITAHADGTVKAYAYSAARAEGGRLGSMPMLAQLMQLDAEATFLRTITQAGRKHRFAVVAASSSGAVKLRSLMRGAPRENLLPLEVFKPLCDAPRMYEHSVASGFLAVAGGDAPRSIELWDLSAETIALRSVIRLESYGSVIRPESQSYGSVIRPEDGLCALAFADSLNSLFVLLRTGALCLFDLTRRAFTIRTQLGQYVDGALPSVPKLSWGEDEGLLLAGESQSEGVRMTAWDVCATVGNGSASGEREASPLSGMPTTDSPILAHSPPSGRRAHAARPSARAAPPRRPPLGSPTTRHRIGRRRLSELGEPLPSQHPGEPSPPRLEIGERAGDPSQAEGAPHVLAPAARRAARASPHADLASSPAQAQAESRSVLATSSPVQAQAVSPAEAESAMQAPQPESGPSQAQPEASPVQAQPSLLHAREPMHDLGECEIAAEWTVRGTGRDDTLTLLLALGQGAYCLGFYSGEAQVCGVRGERYGRLRRTRARDGRDADWTAPPVANQVVTVDDIVATANLGLSSPSRAAGGAGRAIAVGGHGDGLVEGARERRGMRNVPSSPSSPRSLADGDDDDDSLGAEVDEQLHNVFSSLRAGERASPPRAEPETGAARDAAARYGDGLGAHQRVGRHASATASRRRVTAEVEMDWHRASSLPPLRPGRDGGRKPNHAATLLRRPVNGHVASMLSNDNPVYSRSRTSRASAPSRVGSVAAGPIAGHWGQLR
jgi:WD40 repeat protein